MNYQLTLKRREYYNTHIVKVIKVQSLIKRRYWLITYIKLINKYITIILQRKSKEYVYEPTIFGDSSIENIKMLEISFKQRQKQMKEGKLAQIVIGLDGKIWDLVIQVD